jgi:hypothetical protein
LYKTRAKKLEGCKVIKSFRTTNKPGKNGIEQLGLLPEGCTVHTVAYMLQKAELKAEA